MTIRTICTLALVTVFGCQPADESGEPAPEQPAEQSATSTSAISLCVANENAQGGVSCFGTDGLLSGRYTATNGPSPLDIGTTSGLAVLDGGMFISTNQHIFRLDLAAGGIDIWPTSYDVVGLNVNTLGIYDGQLVALGAAGGSVHQLDATGAPVGDGPMASEITSPQGFAVGENGTAYAIGEDKTWKLEPQADGTFEQTVLHEISSVDPAYFNDGGFVHHDGVLYYTDHGPDWQEGHVIAFDLATETATVVATIQDNPRGLAVDAAGQWLYVSRMIAAAIDRIEIASLSSVPVIETFVRSAAYLDGPYGLAFVQLP